MTYLTPRAHGLTSLLKQNTTRWSGFIPRSWWIRRWLDGDLSFRCIQHLSRPACKPTPVFCFIHLVKPRPLGCTSMSIRSCLSGCLDRDSIGSRVLTRENEIRPILVLSTCMLLTVQSSTTLTDELFNTQLVSSNCCIKIN